MEKASKKVIAPVVYVVDDNDGMRSALETLLSTVGYRTAAFPSAREFLEGFNSDVPGCLVLDVCMPDMSGVELQRQLNRTGAMLPVIFVTGHGDVPMAVDALKEGAFEFVEKPFRDQDLLDRINQALQRDTENRRQLARFDEVRQRFDSLTPRERQVSDMIVAGSSNKVMGIDLGVSERTIEIHRAKVMEKIGVRSVAHLVKSHMLLSSGH